MQILPVPAAIPFRNTETPILGIFRGRSLQEATMKRLAFTEGLDTRMYTSATNLRPKENYSDRLRD
jgi:hypothetical protein